MNFLKNVLEKRREKKEKEKADMLAESQRVAFERRKAERGSFIRRSLAKLTPNNQSKDGYVEKGFSVGNLSDIMNGLEGEWDNIIRESMFEYENRNIENVVGSEIVIYLYSNFELVKSIPSYDLHVRNCLSVTCLSPGLYAYKRNEYKRSVD